MADGSLVTDVFGGADVPTRNASPRKSRLKDQSAGCFGRDAEPDRSSFARGNRVPAKDDHPKLLADSCRDRYEKSVASWRKL
jgi:hypothetical protein